LARDGQARQVCGFWSGSEEAPSPNSWAFFRFLASVIDQVELLKAMFDRLVDQIA
jgi:hypothetical protein